jgi:hypothetical protein
MRTARSLTSILFLGAATTLLAACPSSEDAKVQFATATVAQRAAVVPAAIGLTGEQAANLVTLAEIDHAAGASCPARAVEGDAVVYTAAGCKGAASGITWNGRIEAVNSPRTDRLGASIDGSKPEELRFVGVHADRPDAPLAVDGLLRVSPGTLAGDVRILNQLTTTTTESISLDVESRCSHEGGTIECRSQPGASGEIAGLGHFDLIVVTSATLDQLTARVVLRGEDELRLDSAVRDANGCPTLLVAGAAAGSVCLPELSDAAASRIAGASWTCAEGNAVKLTGFAADAPIFAKVELRQGTSQQEIALAFVSRDATTKDERWESAATPLAEGLTCASLGDIGVRAVAVYADGRIDCQTTGDWEAFDGRGCF